MSGQATRLTSPSGVLINEGKSVAGQGLEELREAFADSGPANPPCREVSKSKKAPEPRGDRDVCWIARAGP